MPEEPTGERIRDIRIEDDLKSSYLRYAMSTLISRALPRVEDGLKPSQRRILVAINDLDLGPRSKHRKCAKIVGDTCGNYHPHGNQVVYPTLVRMAQSFASRYPLINGQGNFGSLDGDPPAAERYTEARMDYPTMEMLADIEKDTVDFVPNYEETRDEPTVLPAKFPNLLCNGSSGIAVGMSTSIPPHNLCEVVDALIAVIDNPGIDLAGVMQFIQGPDFPTGAVICGKTAIRNAYATGRGNVAVRAKASVETRGSDRKNIVVTEIPYQLTRASIKEKIANAVNAGRITGIADIRDESDRTGQRIVIQLKRGEDENIVLNQLYKHTPLQTTFSILLIALHHGRPQTMTLVDILRAYRSHRVTVIRRRTEYMLRKAEARAHILEGLKIALNHIDEVIALIRKSKDVASARDGLMSKFKLSKVQAQAILEMRLQRLTNLERGKIDEEYRALIEKINEYKAILESEKLVFEIIKEELLDLKQKYGDERRTEIRGSVEDIDLEDLITEENVAVTVSHEAYIKRMQLGAYRTQGRGGVLHGIHPRLHLVLHDRGQGLLAEGVRHSDARPDVARAVDSKPARDPGRRGDHVDDPRPQLRRPQPDDGDGARDREEDDAQRVRPPAARRHHRHQPRQGRQADRRADDVGGRRGDAVHAGRDVDQVHRDRRPADGARHARREGHQAPQGRRRRRPDLHPGGEGGQHDASDCLRERIRQADRVLGVLASAPRRAGPRQHQDEQAERQGRVGPRRRGERRDYDDDVRRHAGEDAGFRCQRHRTEHAGRPADPAEGGPDACRRGSVARQRSW